MKYFKISHLNKIVLSLFITIVFSIVIAVNAFAMGVSISFSEVNASVGDEVDLVMTVSSTEGEIDSSNIMLSYDDSKLEFISGTNSQGGAGSIKVTSNTGNTSSTQNFSLKFKAKSPGDTTVVVSTWEVYDKESKMATMQSQGTGKIKITEAASTANETTTEAQTVSVDKRDASLSSLKVSPGKLVPEFDSDIKNYDMNVGGNILNVAVNAKARQDGAKVIITGNDNLVVGVTRVTVKVTAPDGSTVQNYIINVNKAELPSVSDETTESAEAEKDNSVDALEIVSTSNGMRRGGIDYQVSDSFNKNTLPEGFEETTFNYKGREIKAGKMKDRDVYILYLVGNDGSGDFYIYDKDSDKWSVYAQISTGQRLVTIMPRDDGVEVPKGFVQRSINVNGKKIDGWLWGSDNDNRYCVVYAMNSEGRKDFYRYDMEEKTIQRYFVDPNTDAGFTSAEYNALQKKYDELNTNTRNIIYALITLSVVLFLALLGVSLLNRNRKAKQVTRMERGGDGRSKANISSKVNLIPEEEMSDETPLEYMPLGQKKEEDSGKFKGIDPVLLDEDERNPDIHDESDDFEDLDI